MREPKVGDWVSHKHWIDYDTGEHRFYCVKKLYPDGAFDIFTRGTEGTSVRYHWTNPDEWVFLPDKVKQSSGFGKFIKERGL